MKVGEGETEVAAGAAVAVAIDGIGSQVGYAIGEKGCGEIAIGKLPGRKCPGGDVGLRIV